MRSKIVLSFLILLTSLQFASAQFKRSKSKGFTKHEKLQYTAGFGLTSYYGDLCDKYECMQFRPNFGIGAIYRLFPNISARVDVAYYRLYSKDVYEYRNLDFRSWNIEGYAGLQYDLYSYSKHYRKRKKIQPYVFAGVGGTYFNPKGKDPETGDWIALRPLKTEGQATPYMPFTLILPYGAGFRYKWRPKYDFIFEIGYRKTFTDNLDDVSSKEYINRFETDLDPVVARMSMRSNDPYYSSTAFNPLNGDRQQRGNPDRKDGYFLLSLKVRYIVGAKSVVFKGKHPLLKPHHK